MRNKGRDRQRTLIACVIGAAALAPCAESQAQTAAPAAAPAAAPESVTLEEVVVSAERRVTDLQKTALSIVALDSVALQEKGISNLNGLAQATPGLATVTDIENVKPVFMIRGVGNASGRESQEGGVALYVDDIYLPRANGAYLNLVDVDRVEVLRGPQGTLFGRNSSGGAIRYMTRKPTHEFEARGTISVGNDDLRTATALVNVPFGEKLAGRFQVGRFKQDGYINLAQANTEAGNTDDTVARGVLRLSATDFLTIDAGMTYAKSDRDRPAVVVLSNNITDFQTRALSARLVALGQPALTNNDPRFVYADKYTASGACYLDNNTLAATANNINTFDDRSSYCRNGQNQTTKVGFVDINWALSDLVTARALSGYVDGKTDSTADGGGLGTVRFGDIADYNSFSQEVQLIYSTSRLHLVGGLYYFREHPIRNQYNGQLATTPGVLGQCCQGAKIFTDLRTESFGAFSQATISFTDALSLTLGARYSKDDKDIAVRRSDRPTTAPGALFTNSDSWSHADFRSTLQYQFTPDLMGYATVSTGYKAGGFNDSVQAGSNTAGGILPYDPEKVTNYELGLKSQWFDNRVRFNLTGFLMNYEDMQLTSPFFDNATTPPTTVLITQNAGKIRLSGVEAELMWRATNNLTLNASASTLHQKALEISDGNGLLITSTCTNPAVRTFDTCDTQDIAASPKYQLTAGALYSLGLASGELNFGANFSYTAEKFSQNANASTVLLPGYGLLNVRAEYAPTDAHWSVSLFGNNVTDKYYLLTGQNGVGFFGSTTAIVGRPATYGAEVSVRF
jgi:iron complex outermembrane receptor protein